VRGNNFKPHGGFILNGGNNADIILPLEAKVISGARYIEAGEVQYMFDFEADCNVRIRLDHLHTLSPQMQSYADKLPEPKQDDSRTTNITGDRLPAGTLIATKIGFPSMNNTSFDFGVYDMNTKNKASKSPDWPNSPDYQNDYAMHAVCWFDWLSPDQTAFVRSLPAGDGVRGKESVYCE
jgi:hypothetical protein